jgi:subtilase family serine protease
MDHGYEPTEELVREGRPVATGAGACAVALSLALAGCTGSLAPQHDRAPGGVAAASGLPGGGLSPAQVWAAYDLEPLLREGIDGKGQTIVVVEPFGSPTIRHDLAVFDQRLGLQAPPALRVIQPAGAVPRYRPTETRTSAAGETTLDVEWAHAMAPGAAILLVETPAAENEGRSGFPQIVGAEEYVIKHHLGGVISQSFGATERTFRSRAALVQLRGAYRLAARPGYRVTVIAATGDSGAAGLTNSTRSFFKTPQVSWPASDPLVTAVGGTQLSLARSGIRRAPAVAWPGSGGGRSAVFPRPAYQDSVANVTGQARGIPDISMDASCTSSVEVYGNDGSYPANPPGWSTGCGTSLAAPMFAGIVALADQEARHTLGAINPALYKMAASHDPGIVDILKGDNSFRFPSNGKTYVVQGFHAQPGYDLISGVGTIDAARFVPELAKAAG